MKTEEMAEASPDLLDDSLIGVSVRGESSEQRLTLPEVLEYLAAEDEITSFTQLQAHQSQAWYCFLCQLAVIALDRADLGSVAAASDRWRELLLALTDGRREPWCLVVPDLHEPAFMQPPVPEGKIDVLSTVHLQPDGLNLIATAKNHDVKLSRIRSSNPAHWIYVLVSIQTHGDYSKAGRTKQYYGTVRKQSAFSYRPFVGVSTGLGWGERFRRDVGLLLSARESIVQHHEYPSSDGLALTYLRSWDGSTSITLDELDPFFIEVCRRVRLERHKGSIRCRTSGTAKRRIAASQLDGNVGDPWIPINKSKGAALRLDGSGFTYDLVSDVLFGGEFQRSLSTRIRNSDPDQLHFLCAGIGSENRNSAGFHERIVPIPGHVRRRLMEGESREELGERAKQRIEVVDTVQTKALRPALCALYQGDPESLDFRDDRPRPWLDRHDERIDRIFFERLWEHADLAPPEASQAWAEEVLEIADGLLEEAIQRAPVPEPRRYRGWAGAERIFAGARRRLLDVGSEHDEDAQEET